MSNEKKSTRKSGGLRVSEPKEARVDPAPETRSYKDAKASRSRKDELGYKVPRTELDEALSSAADAETKKLREEQGG